MPDLPLPFGDPLLDVDVAPFPDTIGAIELSVGEDRRFHQRIKGPLDFGSRGGWVADGREDQFLTGPEVAELSEGAQDPDRFDELTL